MKRMTIMQWKALPPKDKEALKTLGILDLVKPKKSKTLKSKAYPLLKPYILKRISTCTICKVVSTNYFRMIPAQGKYLQMNTAIKREDILPSEIETIKEAECYYSGCPHCYEVLAKESKEELIRRIIILTRGR